MVAIWDYSDEETSNEEESLEVLNLTLMATWEKLDEVNNLPSYDELIEAFTKLHNNLKNIRMKNASLKKKNVELSNENDILNENVKCLEVEKKSLDEEIVLFF